MARTSKPANSRKQTSRKAPAQPVKNEPPRPSQPIVAKAADSAKTTTARFSASAGRSRLVSRLNPNRLLAELFGTLILTLVVIAALSGNFVLSFFASPEVLAQAVQANQQIPAFSLAPFVAGLALAALVLATYKISGGLLNPAITLGLMALKKMNPVEGAGYIIAQCLGAMLALSIASGLITSVDPVSGQASALNPATLFNHAANWRIFSAELVGSFVFGFGVAAAMTYRALPRAILFGGSFTVGIGVALMADAGVLNPALALGVGLIGFGDSNLWQLAGIYLGGSTLGVIIGMALYTLLNRSTAPDKLAVE